MKRRISRGGAEDKIITSATPEDIAAHLEALRQLAKIANRMTCAAIAFELRMGCSVDAFETACLQVARTDLRRKEFLTLREAARRLGVSAMMLRKDNAERFPKPVRGSGRTPIFSREDIDDWLRRHTAAE